MIAHAMEETKAGRRVLRFTPDQGFGEGRWVVNSGGLLVATIRYEDDKYYEPDKPWCWQMQDIHAGPDIMDTHGFGQSLEDAKKEIVANFKKWIEWAEL